MRRGDGGWRFEETGKTVDVVYMQSELTGEMKMVIWAALRDVGDW